MLRVADIQRLSPLPLVDIQRVSRPGDGLLLPLSGECRQHFARGGECRSHYASLAPDSAAGKFVQCPFGFASYAFDAGAVRLAVTGFVPHPRLGQVHAASPQGKPALTHVRVLAADGGSAIVEATIPTGRPHQIRIHLAAAGHPLVGDPLYAAGGRPAREPGLPGDPGYRLHAHRLGFPHPATGRRIELECPLPSALQSAPLTRAGQEA